MKFCPTCQTRYDEEILRFCTKDGTPLVEEQPHFTALPSEASAEDDFGEETVIRRNPPKAIEPDAAPATTAERIVIPTVESSRQEVRAQTAAAPPQAPPPRSSNTATVVLVTILGTLLALALGAGAFWLFSSDRPANEVNVNQANANSDSNSNADANFNTDLFSNTNADANANANANVNTNANANANTDANANLRTPSPTRTPSPSPSPSETPADANTNANAAPANTNTDARPPSPTPTPTAAPRPSATPTVPANVNVGVMNSRAVSLPKPAYPPTARQMGASGQVTVAVTVDEAGNVLSARAVSGHPLLRVPAEAAARQSRFNPVKIGEQTVRANGILVYNFINQ